MNYSYFRKRVIDFLYNLTVVSTAVAIYEKIWYGLFIAICLFILATILSFFVEKE